MRERIITIFAYLHGALLIFVLLPPLAFFASLFEYSTEYNFCLLLIVFLPFLVASLSAEYCKSIFTFVLFSLLSVAAELLIPMPILTRVISLILSVVIVIIKLVGRINETNDILVSPHAAVLILFGVVFVFGTIENSEFIRKLSYWSTFCYALSVLIYMNSGRMEEYLTINEGVANIPYRQIRRTNYGMLGIYLAITSAAMLILPFTNLDRLLSSFLNALKSLFLYLVSLGNHESDIETSIESYSEEIPPLQPESPIEGLPEKEASPVVKAIMDTIFYLILITVAIGLLIALGRFLISIVKKFYRPYRENGDEQEFISPIDEKETLAEILAKNRPLFLDFSPNAAVRKAYRRAVEKSAGHRKNDGSLNMKTPQEIEDHVGMTEKEHRSELHVLYEKARYSKNGVSKDEVRAMKE